MPLTMAKNGELQTIKRISGKDETKHFLESLGFVIGAGIIIISQASGNMIVDIKNTRVAISKAMANRIMI